MVTDILGIEVPIGPLTTKPEYASQQLQQILENKQTSTEVRPANRSGGYELEYLSTPSLDSGDALTFLHQKPIREANMESWVGKPNKMQIANYFFQGGGLPCMAL